MRLDLPMGGVSKSLRIYHSSYCFILFQTILPHDFLLISFFGEFCLQCKALNCASILTTLCVAMTLMNFILR